MLKCPNCGQTTARTEDWACQWCGYPLLSESYEKIPKTYRQLKGEKLYEQEPLTEPEPESMPEPQRQPIPEPEAELKPKPQPESILALEPEPTSTTVEVTVEELYLAYKADKAAADAKLMNKILKVTGVVDKIVVNNIHEIYYIILASAAKKEEWNVRCTFDKEYGAGLNALAAGQTVTVQGTYYGYKLNVLMRDCVLIG